MLMFRPCYDYVVMMAVIVSVVLSTLFCAHWPSECIVICACSIFFDSFDELLLSELQELFFVAGSRTLYNLTLFINVVF